MFYGQDTNVISNYSTVYLSFHFTDLLYVAVADTHTHIYVFCQPGCVDAGGELRNRKSGRRVGRVARQLVVTLKNHDPILGLHTAPGRLYVLTGKALYVYCIPVTL